jgi:hydrogenase nickel incorporation protein HypA/HybF
MHELAVTRSVVALALEHASGARITRVVVEIGKLSGVLPDAVRFCFEVCTRGTGAEGATLEVVEIPGRARCRVCGIERPVEYVFGQCGCGNTDLELTAGHELRVRELEVI